MRRILKEYETVVLHPEDIADKIDFGEIFGRCGPVHIEIGSGKGTFLVNQAKTQPEVDFLGIEWAGKYYRHAVDRVGRWDLRNVRIIRADAAQFLAEYVEDSTVMFFHVYFPDPWPKKRHHKRRFFKGANMEQMLRCLDVGGVINVATDYAEYFEPIEDVIRQEVLNKRAELIDFIRPVGAVEGEMVGTNYERKYIKENRNIYTIAARKLA